MALGGCAAGQVAQTAYQANSATGATVTSNGIAIRDAQIAFPSAEGTQTAAVYRAGGTAPVEMHVINQRTQADRLVSASSPVAGSVTVGGQTDLPAGTAMVVGGESGTGGQSAPGATEPSAEPSLDRLARRQPRRAAPTELGARAAGHLAHRVGHGER